MRHLKNDLGAAPRLPVLVFSKNGKNMLWTLIVLLCILWLLGFLTSYTLGGFIHILLVVALVIFVFNLIQGRKRMV